MCSRICLFVVFKQKTSYEMRISDWSSDVCSSDLPITNHCSVPETNTTRAKEQQCRSNRLRNWVAVETKNRCREISATITIFCQTINNNERHIKRDIGTETGIIRVAARPEAIAANPQNRNTRTEERREGQTRKQ